jgi:hypothetical protein
MSSATQASANRRTSSRSLASGVTRCVQAAIGRDPVQPSAQRRALLKAGDAAPSAHHRLLKRVLSVLHRAKDPITVELQLPAIAVGEFTERILFSLDSPAQELLTHEEILAAQEARQETKNVGIAAPSDPARRGVACVNC